MNKINWKLNWDGDVIEYIKRGRLWRFFHRHRSSWKVINEYVPKKPYNDTELKAIRKFLYYERTLDAKDIAIIINSIRPNTFKESVEEIKTSKYYYNATAKEDINLLKSSK